VDGIIALAILDFVLLEVPQWIRLGKSRGEQIEAACPQAADASADQKASIGCSIKWKDE
jgi:hypothetical protein